MSEQKYKYIAIGLGVVALVLLAMLLSQPKPVDVAALKEELSDFRASLEQWNAQYGKNPTPESKTLLSDELSLFAKKLDMYVK